VPLPKEYSGEEDIEKFDGWLQSLLQWYFAGPKYKHEHITLMAMFLGKKPRHGLTTTLRV
jgi:hypothetical protein